MYFLTFIENSVRCFRNWRISFSCSVIYGIRIVSEVCATQTNKLGTKNRKEPSREKKPASKSCFGYLFRPLTSTLVEKHLHEVQILSLLETYKKFKQFHNLANWVLLVEKYLHINRRKQSSNFLETMRYLPGENDMGDEFCENLAFSALCPPERVFKFPLLRLSPE